MRNRMAATAFLCLTVFSAGVLAAAAGDSLFGTVTAVRRADLVVFDYGAGQYDLRLIGIELPRDRETAERARRFVADLVLGKKARMRFEYRTKDGEMLSRLFTADTTTGIRDVAVELVRAGLVRRQPNYDYKYNELSIAEAEARRTRRGVWATTTR